MKTKLTVSLLTISLVAPLLTFAASPAGLTPKSPFYFLDTLFERINLAFTFNPEKKATKALLFAEERLAEVATGTNEDEPEVIKTLMANYQENVALAAEKSKEVKDEKKAEELLNKIADDTAKHQEVLTEVLAKVPEVAKEAITKAIKASKNSQEEAHKQIAELKQEVAGLKQEIVELKKQQRAEPTPLIDTQSQSIQELKKEIEKLKKQSTEKESEKKVVAPATPTSPASSIPEPKSEVKANDYILILTNSLGISYTFDTRTNNNQKIQDLIDIGFSVTQGKLPEGTIIKRIIETPTLIPAPTPTSQPKTIEIFSVSAYPTLNSARIEWQTNIPTNSKVFLSGGSFSSKVYNSESGLSTRHVVNIAGLGGGTTYSYEIEAITSDQVTKNQGSFSTKPLPVFTSGPTPSVKLLPVPVDGHYTAGEYYYKASVEWASNGAAFLNNTCSPNPLAGGDISPISMEVRIREHYSCVLKIKDIAGNSAEKEYSFTVGPGFIRTRKINIPSGLLDGENVSIYRLRIDNHENWSYATSTLIKSLTLKLKKSASPSFSINSISGAIYSSAPWDNDVPYSTKPKLSFSPMSFSDFTDEKIIVFNAPIRMVTNVSEV